MTSTATARTLELLDPQRCARLQDGGHGYYDVLGDDLPKVRSVPQRLMRTKAYSAGYQVGRPIGLKLAGGPKAPDRDEDRQQMSAWLGLAPDSTVLDIGCGPGNFTGWFGTQVLPQGLAVGVDASHAMLRRAAADNPGPSVAYVRGDAENLPFADGVADAVSCLAALYLINKPLQAIDEFARVLKPGGRLVILTSLHRGKRQSTVGRNVLEAASGIRWFGRHEITGFLGDLGFIGIEQRVAGLTQTVVATKRAGG
jgi:SAM-dependent methyltransferase